VLREVAAHHGTQDEADTGGCVEVSHDQRALGLGHQVRQQRSADGQRVLEQPWGRKQSTPSETPEGPISPLGSRWWLCADYEDVGTSQIFSDH